MKAQNNGANELPQRAALYARVSTTEQVEGYSIDAHRRAFQTMCHGRGWVPFREYVEEGKSARTENINKRPVFKQMVTDALIGEFDVLVVHKLDRFSRNLMVTLEHFHKMSAAGVAFVSVSEQMDFTTPWGKLSLTMLGGMAEFYSDNLSQETKKGKRERRAQGLYLGILPFGVMKGPDKVPKPHDEVWYIRDKVGNTTQERPPTYEGLLLAFQLAADGKADKEVAQALNSAGYCTTGNRGGRPFAKDTVRGIIQNRFYIGELPDGEAGWVGGKHEAIIPPELFEAAQQARARRGHRRHTIASHASTFSLSTLMKCRKCNSGIRIHQSPKGRPRVYCAGRSQGSDCDFRGTFLDTYEAQIEWYLATFHIPEDYRERIVADHAKLRQGYDDIGKQKARLDKYLSRLKNLYSWGDIPEAEYHAQRTAAEQELRALIPPDVDGEQTEKLAHFLANIADAWKQATHEQRNKLAKALFEEIWAEDSRVVAVKPHPELEPFFRLSYKRHARSLACGPDGKRSFKQYLNSGLYPVCAPTHRATPWKGKLTPSSWPGLAAHRKKASLRQLAATYGVSHEAVRRTSIAAHP